MKKNKYSILIFIWLIAVLCVTCSCSGGAQNEKNIVNVYNWGEYIDKDLLTKFEEETGIKVIYSNFNTNEDMYVKLKNGGSNYDVVVPSDYMIEKMIRENMLRPINWENVPNLKYVDKESAPKSSIKLASITTASASHPKFSTIMFLTVSNIIIFSLLIYSMKRINIFI